MRSRKNPVLPRRAWRRFIAKLGLVCAIALGVRLSEIPDASAQPTPFDKSGASTRAPDGIPSTFPHLNDLIAQAQTTGSVRVIVGLGSAFQPEGRLRQPSAVQSQRAAIARAQDGLARSLATRNARVTRRLVHSPFVALQVDAEALRFLSTLPDVVSITQDQLRHPTLAESTPLIGATNAWASGFSGLGQTVAILDTGVDNAHPFLTGKVVSEACYSTTDSFYSSVTLCPGGVFSSTDPGSGINCTGYGLCGHGTHVAGIAAGKDDGTVGFSGVAKDASIIAIQVFSGFPGGLGAFDSDIAAGLDRVQTLSASHNIAAANLSLGGGSFTTYCDDESPAVKTAIDGLRSLGIATVISAGNDSTAAALEFPGCISTAVSVGSTQDGSFGGITDHISGFSNSASFLNLLAPGQVIKSSWPGGLYYNLNGTSMASPHVTGAWAVVKSKRPSDSVDNVLCSLSGTGKPIYDSRNGLTKPRLQVDSALLASCRIFLPLIFNP